MADDKVDKEVEEEKKTPKAKRGIWSRIWNGLFRPHDGDFEKRLQHISKEEATLLARMNRRSSSWRSTARNIVYISFSLEVVALGYAIITTRTAGLDWQMRALRVLPIFLLPALSSALHWVLASFKNMRDSRDQKTVDRLRAERQAKIDELKERTNYYITQQLIQKYDPDPAAKAAAGSVLASKLGADSGLKVHLGDEFQQPSPTGKSHDVDPVTSTGLRKRNTADPASKGGNDMEMTQHMENEILTHNELVVEHHNPAAYGSQDDGWLARLAQLLVGEDPSQSYALICGNCHMHNGLARKEDFPFITYYCPRCHALNRPRNSGPYTPSTSTLTSPTMQAVDPDLIKQNSRSTASSPVADPVNMSEKVSPTTSPVADTVDTSEKVSHLDEVEASEQIVTEVSHLDEVEASEQIVTEDASSQ